MAHKEAPISLKLGSGEFTPAYYPLVIELPQKDDTIPKEHTLGQKAALGAAKSNEGVGKGKKEEQVNYDSREIVVMGEYSNNTAPSCFSLRPFLAPLVWLLKKALL